LGAMGFARVHVNRVDFCSVLLCSHIMFFVWLLTLKFDRVL
jgi:hypothetical protein